jgi:hypothetical protein
MLEQDFKSPEEIRMANLRGADLRGAKNDDTDFYLVDLRDALYDVRQEEHFRRCGAILVARARHYPNCQRTSVLGRLTNSHPTKQPRLS